jgi:hypothetical protein
MRRVVLWGGRAGDLQFGSPADRQRQVWLRQRAAWMRMSVKWAEAMTEIQKAALASAKIMASAMLSQRAKLPEVTR